MSNINNDEMFPDITGIFDIDESSVPNVPISRTGTEPKKKSEKILTAKEAERLAKTEKRKQEREEKIRIAKTRAIFILSVVVLVLIAILVTKAVIAEKKKPVVAVEKAVTDSIERSYTSEAAVLKNPLGTYVVMIDNDYDIHFLEKKQPAEITRSDGSVLTGTVEKIQEEDQQSTFFEKLISTLLQDRPETSVYSVYITAEDPEGVLKDGEKVTVRIVTKTVDKALLIPSAAVLSNDAQCFVWMYHPMKKVLSKQDVTVGISADGMTEILSGLEKGDSVVTDCVPDDLYNGVKVKLK